MTPFQQFRLWAHRAPVAERIGTAVVAVALLAVLGWVIVPVTDSGEAAASTEPSALTYADLTGGSEAPLSTGPVSTAGQPCDPPPADAQGVTDDTVNLAVVLVNLGGAAGNATFGLPAPDEQEKAFKAVAKSVNETGGAGCRQVALKFYEGNPSSQDQMHQTCLKILQDKPFAVLDEGGFDTQASCIASAKVPFLTARLNLSEQTKYYPYLFANQANDLTVRNTLFALKDLKFFEGDQKVGVVYGDCNAGLVDVFFDSLKEIEIPDSQVTKYDLGCPESFSAPSAIQQAVLKFKGAGVTRVLTLSMNKDFANFTKTAAAQNFKPKYGLADNDGVLDITYGLLGPDFGNIEGSIGIAATSFGAEHSDTPAPAGTQACSDLMATVGLAPVYEELTGMGGIACSQLWAMQAMLNHVDKITQAGLAEGLSKAGTLPFSYPNGPTANNDPKVTFGGQYWRAMEFKGDCQCWTLLDDTFKPGFP
ncbi:ABC transporter substrate-binding protein [Nocardioides sp. CN2-186]|uniref:ABC transporter substrate-binding protein n=1 Tax=Nocardioides tweenelious TaxID=3156607 RepID=UPI0032B5CE4F